MSWDTTSIPDVLSLNVIIVSSEINLIQLVIYGLAAVAKISAADLFMSFGGQTLPSVHSADCVSASCQILNAIDMTKDG